MYMDELKNRLRPLIKEVLEKKYTDTEKSWSDMMIDLSKYVNKPIVRDAMGNYNISDCEPHHVHIRPIVHNIFDCVYIKDGTDREKILYVEYPVLKKWISEKLNCECENYVDKAYLKNRENAIDKESSSSDKDGSKLTIGLKGIKTDPTKKVKDMNEKQDDPTEDMRDVDKKNQKQIDIKSKNPKYKIPKLDKEAKKLVLKYGRKKTSKLK